MGQIFSKEASNKRRGGQKKRKGKEKASQNTAQLNISHPSGGLQMVPTPQRDEGGRPVVHRDFQINANQIIRAFRYMAEYLQQHGANITVITVGGAVNTVLLGTRETTHDVDYFGAAQHGRLLRDASKHAQSRSSSQLGAAWFNNSTALYVSNDMAGQLMDAAVHQNAIVFQEPGLTVLAAPWIYCMCGKIDRMVRGNTRPYDVQDAVEYLHQYLQAHSPPIPAALFEDRCTAYGRNFNIKALNTIAQAYHEIHGLQPIAFPHR